MSQVQHIAKNLDNLILRANIIRLIREFFWSEKFLELETPNILSLPGQEPYLTPMRVEVQNEKKEKFLAYLHTSPEYSLKKALAAGFKNIFSICKCYRNEESFGGTHNPEFTMIEWYRTDVNMFKIMDDVENLFKFLFLEIRKIEKLNLFQNSSRLNRDEIQNFERISMKELWQKYVGVNLDDYLEKEKMFILCKERKFNPSENESYEDLFYRIFLNEIEPKIGIERPAIVYNYPAQMAALSKISKTDHRYAERFEVYIDGLELANAFTELTDSEEQLHRLKMEKEERKKNGKDVYEVDLEFVNALKTMPDCSGIALGVDRLVQLFTGCKNIDDVLLLPASKIFKT